MGMPVDITRHYPEFLPIGGSSVQGKSHARCRMHRPRMPWESGLQGGIQSLSGWWEKRNSITHVHDPLACISKLYHEF